MSVLSSISALSSTRRPSQALVEKIISDYREQRKQQRDMELEVRRVELSLMPPEQRYYHAMRKFKRGIKKWRGMLQKCIRDYRNTLAMCPGGIQLYAQQQLERECPHYITTRERMAEALRQLREVAHNQVIESAEMKGFIENSSTTRDRTDREEFAESFALEISRIWYNILLQAFNLFEGAYSFPFLNKDLVHGLHSLQGTHSLHRPEQTITELLDETESNSNSENETKTSELEIFLDDYDEDYADDYADETEATEAAEETIATDYTSEDLP